MEPLYCQGCGVKIQTENKTDVGYAPTSALTKEVVLCQRCFRLKHYNETQDVPVTDESFLKMVSSIRETDSLIVHIVDIFDVSGSLIKSLPRITGNNPILLVGNKFDLLPQSTNQNRLINWLKKEAKDAGLTVQDVFLLSSKTNLGMDQLKAAIEQHRNGKDVYIVGTTNVGKSTFINQLIKQTTGFSDVITTSYFPGTTLGFIEIALDDESVLVDTPGIVNKQQMVHFVSDKDLKIITPKKEIKARGYQLNTNQTLYFGGLARLDFIKGKRKSFICYFSNELDIHRTKLEKADDLYENHKGKLLTPPSEATSNLLPELKAHAFKLPNEKTDIVFPGLGWVTVEGGETTVVAHSPAGVPVTIRKSLI